MGFCETHPNYKGAGSEAVNLYTSHPHDRGADFDYTKEEARSRVGRPSKLAVRLYLAKTVVKEYELSIIQS